MKPSSKIKQEYSKRIHIVIDFIDKNLDKNLSLHSLAEKAAFSPFHFHRIFLFVTGETVNNCIIRKRIEKIASLLITGSKYSLQDLAYIYGFSNGNSFSRSFKKFYGVNPKEFKEHFSKIGIQVLTYEKYICNINCIKK